MGFDESQALDALTECGGQLDRAINFLLDGSLGPAASTTNSSSGSGATNTHIIHSEISQYSDPNGRSACTSIALTMAASALSALHQSKNDASFENTINSTFLAESIRQGVQTYNEIAKNNQAGAEHLSVEEFLQLSASLHKFDCLKLLPNSPRQGILSSSNDNPMGFESIISQCQSEATSQFLIGVVITKPPETVLILVPPSGQQHQYVLLDSHPRPNQLIPYQPAGSYALFHPNLPSLVRSLKDIFSVLDLGSDVNEMMAMMYNSFDVYPFEFITE